MKGDAPSSGLSNRQGTGRQKKQIIDQKWADQQLVNQKDGHYHREHNITESEKILYSQIIRVG